MRVVTWNCRRALPQSAVWDYLLDLSPDVVCLQEVSGIPEYIERTHLVFQRHPVRRNGSPHHFMSSILVRGSVADLLELRGPAPWVNSELQHFAGNLIGVRVQLHSGPWLNVICVYSPAWPVDNGRLADIDVSGVRLKQSRDVWVADLLWAALSHMQLQPAEPWIVAGDFNLCETFDAWRGGPRGNREFLDRMAQVGLVDCLRYARGGLTPTFRTPRGGTVTAKLDYLWVTDILRANLTCCETGPREHVFELKLSDHLPVIADFDYGRNETEVAASA